MVRALQELRVRWLVTIGGDDTAFSATRVAAQAGGALSVVHVPKTIDNDLPLPGGIVTFGYETARHVGVSLVETIMEDARATSRWYLLVAMGRKAGHLALGIGKAAGATLTLIPEEFAGRAAPGEARRRIEGRSLARDRRRTAPWCSPRESRSCRPADLAGIENAERDDHGHVRLSGAAARQR